MLTTESLASKYRPTTLDGVVGQNRAVRVIKTILKRGVYSTAYQFEGMRGNGKTTLARILACGMLCKNFKNDGNPCLVCDSCKSFLNKNHQSFYELDAATNSSIEDIKKIVSDIKNNLISGSNYVFIIDENHMISTAGQMALLRMIEDGGGNFSFIFCTTEREKVLPTLYSRCLDIQVDFVDVNNIIDRLLFICNNENIKYDLEAIHKIAIISKNHVRDAIMILDKLSIFGIIDDNLVRNYFDFDTKEMFLEILAYLSVDINKTLGILNNLLCRKNSRDISLGISKAAQDSYLYGKNGSVGSISNVFMKTVYDQFGDSLLVISKFFGSPPPYLSQEALIADILLVESRMRVSAPLYDLISSGPSPLHNFIKFNSDSSSQIKTDLSLEEKARKSNNSDHINNKKLTKDQFASLLGGSVLNE